MMDARETYKQFAIYYDHYTQNYTGDIPLYLALCTPDDQILEVGCGTGRILKHLLEKGYTLTGIDISDAMLDIARTKLASYIDADRLALYNHNLLDEPWPHTYSKILVTWYTFNYIGENPDIFLRNIYNALKSGACAVFDLFCPVILSDPALDGQWREKTIPVPGKTVILRDKRTFDGTYEYREQIYREDGKESRIMTKRRYYPIGEMVTLLEKNGFTHIRYTTGYAADKLSTPHKADIGYADYVITASRP